MKCRVTASNIYFLACTYSSFVVRGLLDRGLLGCLPRAADAGRGDVPSPPTFQQCFCPFTPSSQLPVFLAATVHSLVSTPKIPGSITCRGKLLVVPTENIPCSAATVLYLRGKIGALVGGAAEVDKSVLLLIARAGGLDLKSDRFHPPRPKHTVSVSSSDTVSPDASHPSAAMAIILATMQTMGRPRHNAGIATVQHIPHCSPYRERTLLRTPCYLI